MANNAYTQKWEGLATSKVILAFDHCSESKLCSLDLAKLIKYAGRLTHLLVAEHITSKHLEHKLGNLEFAA